MHRTRSGATLIITLLMLCLGQTALAQGTKADYERALGLSARSQGKVFKTRVEPHWFADGNGFWYRNDLADGAREYVRVDAVNGKREAAFDREKLAAALTKATGQEQKADRLQLDRLGSEENGKMLVFRAAGKGWQCDLASYEIKEHAVPAEPQRPDLPRRPGGGGGGPRPVSRASERSPDGKWTTFIKDNNLFLKPQGAGEEAQLTTDGKADDSYTANVHWSPDSSKLVAMRTKKAQEHKVYLIESSPRDQVQPKLQSYDYLKPGDEVAIGKPHLFDLASLKEIPVSDELFANPWSITDLRWEKGGQRFLFLFNQRGHQALRLLAIDGATGKVAPIINEESKTFIDYSGKMYRRDLEDTGEIIWMSERDGWNHLYLYDAKTGEVRNQITKGPWVVRGVDRVDPVKRQIWFRAGGIHPQQDPYYIHFARVNFDGSGLTLLTDGDGTHAIEYSPDGRFLIDTYSRVDMPPVTELRRVADGKLACELERADASALVKTGWQVPERFVAKARDDETDIFGVIFRPTNLDPSRKYPVIENIYAGPQGSFTPKGFQAFYRHQELAELGFIVVQLDGLGTSNRSKKFHDVCWKNLADAGFPDRMKWMNAAAAKYPYLDITRVGVYGGSAGGQNSTGAVLFHPEFYKVAVSDCGCHDNRMDKIWWNEQWMGWPIGPHYADQSNVTNAQKLQGKLMLTVGELDRNVDPASTMQVVNALIKANKDFDLIVFPGGGHGAGGGPYGNRRRMDFFVRHLLGVEPRANTSEQKGATSSK